MSNCVEWIEDMLGAIKESQNPQVSSMIEFCGKACASRKNAEEGMRQLKVSATNCNTRADYVALLNENIPVTIREVEDGIIMHLGKEKCSCPIASEISKNEDMLCECTRGHEKAVWSNFFGKPVDVEIVESFLRGGNDCVIKILV
ncbi:hypothetical protein EAI30_09530 [Romboutsia ilealis]|uniref:L-2-amino-thiazoline-4-carboxylic acid hydrolase n=1 Tax=Romboutsia faecis TaxID=2764597 RepID=A0ABR7JRG7_9FIRM|nr:DUF6144 family protein [Romboutsia faecis]MBC5997512.1 hypothetical protein [Romboutsia faecis]MRN24855.1 hypothetical protein [Romboutsia ilealis]